MATGTVKLQRVLRAPPERIYLAFIEADALAKWLQPYGFTCKVHHLEAKAGGTFRMSFSNFGNGSGNSFGGEYLELVPNTRLRYTDKFDDPGVTGATGHTGGARHSGVKPAFSGSYGLEGAVHQAFGVR